MAQLQIPRGYKPLLNEKETEHAIVLIKDFFQLSLSTELNLTRVTAPLFVKSGTGINDDLNGVERAVKFPVKDMADTQLEIVHSLAKWKRMKVTEMKLDPGFGIYTDMNAIRADEEMDNLHSLYVDQWDWEMCIDPKNRAVSYLKSIVERIYRCLKQTEFYIYDNYENIKPVLPEKITFIYADDLQKQFPKKTPKEREYEVCKKYGAVFIIGIGGKLSDGSIHEQRVLLQNALSRYFPRALAARILAEKRTDLKPADKVLTILFSDISSFTKWSSDKTPETVHAFLSDYLESMAEIIFANGGTVDKFIGDGILAFFGDPYEQSDHTERALRTAIQMQKKVALLRDKWQPVVGIDLKIRIGVNTGNVIVGNLGTKARIDYTVIGSTVNLSSRMESNAPVGGILVAHAARERVGDKFKFTERVEVAAKGYEQPVEAFVLDQGSLSGN